MPHSPELINKLIEIIVQDYPRSMYSIEIEKPLAGTSFVPDLTVRNKSKAVVCVVEIGYTHPEKLTCYRDELHILDVRWYDKQFKLHTPFTDLRVEKFEYDKINGRYFMTIREVAKMFSISLVTAYRRNHIGWIPFYKDPISKKIIYKLKDVLDYMEMIPVHRITSNTHDKYDLMLLARNSRKVKDV